jgi:monoamine oxidase
VATALARESVAEWLDRIRAPKELRDIAIGLRGFFLADPRELSLLVLADQFADGGSPGSEKMFRIVGGNDRLPAVLARALGTNLRLETILRRVTQSRNGVVAALESKGRTEEARFDFLVCTMPAATIGDVVFEPGLRDLQRQAVTSVRYGAATKTALQFNGAPWRRRGMPRAFGTPFSIGAVWDGNEEQRGSILTLLAGGGASAATREMLSAEGPSRLVRELSWMKLEESELVAWTTLSWENEQWSRGGYAYFHQQFAPELRYWLARPFGRVFFAGEHTSLRWQGYMNGAVETGLRAAEEVSRSTIHAWQRSE